ncbi:putative pectinesterase [Rosa chinensis]|uniref:Putative pectinesterase n=1 Tax=Rosa chinensis TaxID=74649 RepID=A0A2P6R441_ROSCH|nr:21 kDa protein [Rosa chinensis]PRQ41119.1 putative pectinesterase [Rosa chinensis]
MKNHLPLTSLSLLIFLFLLRSPPAVGFPSPAPSTNDSDFIRTSCGTTLYPELCYSSLSRYANAVQSNPSQLAKVAIGVSLSNAKRMAAFVSNLSRHADYGSDHRATAALHDCFSNFDDAVDQIRDSLRQMKSLGSAPGSVRFQMSNVQTWMSAALTDQDTCTDGFQDVPDGSVKSDVVNKVEKVKKVTSNALALVNRVAEKGG